MNVPHRVLHLGCAILITDLCAMLVIFIDCLWNDVKMQPLGPLWLIIHEQRQRFGAAISQPLINGQAIALGFGNLLAIRVKKQLV